MAGVLVLARPPGPVLEPDSMSYLGAAESLGRTGVPRVPVASWSDTDSTTFLSHFPPAFPAAIAALGAFGLSPQAGARVVEALSAGSMVGLVVSLGGGLGGWAAGVLAGVLVMVTPAIVDDHLMVISEPLFLAFLLLALTLMVRPRHRPLVAGLAAAGAGMTRYVGISVAGACVLWALAEPGPRAQRIRRAVLASLPPAVATTAWTLRAGEARQYYWRPGILAVLKDGLAAAAAWLAPAVQAPAVGAALAAAVFAAGATVLYRTARLGGRARFLGAVGLLGASYVVVVVLSRMFADEGIILDWRMLSPLFVLAEVALAVALADAWRAWRWRTRAIAVAIFALWLTGATRVDFVEVRGLWSDSWGYESAEWQQSDLARWLAAEGRRHQLFSNDPPAIYFLTHRPSRGLPISADADSLWRFARALERAGGVLLGFAESFELTVPPDTLARRLGMCEVAQLDKATVWAPVRCDRPLEALR